jgi:hypothetical protein
MSSAKITRVAYQEGGLLEGGWRYRMDRLVRANGDLTYACVLAHGDFAVGEQVQVEWLPEYKTTGQARKAAREAAHALAGIGEMGAYAAS